MYKNIYAFGGHPVFTIYFFSVLFFCFLVRPVKFQEVICFMSNRLAKETVVVYSFPFLFSRFGEISGLIMIHSRELNKYLLKEGINCNTNKS